MKTTSMIVITASLLLSSAAYAGDVNINLGPTAPPPPSEFEHSTVKTNPMDYGNINQSPIRGKGAIKVVHNEPAPGDPDAEIIKAKWLLQDKGWLIAKQVAERDHDAETTKAVQLLHDNGFRVYEPKVGRRQ